jgi:hypothetical protein
MLDFMVSGRGMELLKTMIDNSDAEAKLDKAERQAHETVWNKRAGVCVAPLTATVMNSVDPDHIGTASGFNSAVARFGGMIATALLGFVFAEQGSRAALVVSAHVAALVGAGLAALAGASALLLIREPHRDTQSIQQCLSLTPARHSSDCVRKRFSCSFSSNNVSSPAAGLMQFPTGAPGIGHDKTTFTPRPGATATVAPPTERAIREVTRPNRLPTGFIIPAQPVLESRRRSCADCVHEIKHDGYRPVPQRF